MAKPHSKYELKLVCGHDNHAEVVSEVIKNIGCMSTLLASEKASETLSGLFTRDIYIYVIGSEKRGT